MSDAESRLLPGPWGPPGPGAPWRPPTGPWPPVPPGPGFPRPPDFFSALYWLDRAWDDVSATKAFLKKVIAEIAADDPAWLADITPKVGVTDGSTAQPGMVGEFIELNQSFPVPAAPLTQPVSLGVLPAGDWNVWAYAGADQPIESMEYVLSPVPAGFMGNLHMMSWTVGVSESITTVSMHTQAHTVAPSLAAFNVTTNSLIAANGWFSFAARRAR